MSKRLTEKQKAEVISDFVANRTISDIARKFQVSHTAISKILKNYQSCDKGEKKTSKSAKELRRDIIERATTALYSKDFNSLSPDVLLRIIERLSILEPNEDTENLTKATMIFEFKDTSLKKDNEQDNNT